MPFQRAYAFAHELERFAAKVREVAGEQDREKRNREYDDVRNHLLLLIDVMDELYGDHVRSDARDTRRRIDRVIASTTAAIEDGKRVLKGMNDRRPSE